MRNHHQDPLWQALAAMRIEPEGAATSFTAKLAREAQWGPGFAAQVVEEYRRFLYLARIADHPVSPSKAVDRAWHLHLTYSRHYWDELCGRVLQRPLHHDPGLGGAAEEARHGDQYARTLALYRLTFGEEPPASIWPDAVPTRHHAWRVSRMSAVAGATGLLAACSALAGATNADGEGDNALLGFIIIGAFLAGVYYLIRRVVRGRNRGHNRSRHRGRRAGAAGGAYGGHDTGSDWDDRHSSSYDSSDSSSDGGSSCGGGCGGGGD